MRLSPLTTGVLMLHVFGVGADTTSSPSTTTGPQSTVMVTRTQSPTMVWTTKPGANGGVQTPYSQKFTAMFKEIAEPLSGRIGLGYISGSVGKSREYPLATASDASSIYSALASDTQAFNYSGPLTQGLKTDSKGRVVPETWGTIVALGGDKTWYGPTYSQNSDDLTGWGTTTTAVLGSYTGDTSIGQGTSAVTTDSVGAAGAAADAASVTSTSPAAAPVPAATTTSTTTPTPVPGVASTTTTTTPLANGAEIASSTTSSPIPAAGVSTSTTTPIPAAAASTTTTTPIPAAAASTTTTTPVPAAGVSSTSTSVPGAAETTSTTTPLAAGESPTTTATPSTSVTVATSTDAAGVLTTHTSAIRVLPGSGANGAALNPDNPGNQ